LQQGSPCVAGDSAMAVLTEIFLNFTMLIAGTTKQTRLEIS